MIFLNYSAFLTNMLFRTNQKAVTNIDITHIPNTNIIRLGPADFIGTEAFCNIVKAGVFSYNFAFIASNCVRMAL